MLAGLVLASGCAGPIQRAEQYAAQDEWMKAVVEYRKANREHPRDVEFRSRLQQTELKAADYYYQRGVRLQEQGNLEGAIAQFQQGLSAMPEHSKLLQALQQTLARKEADLHYAKALTRLEASDIPAAKDLLQRALDLDPGHRAAAERLTELRRSEAQRAAARSALASGSPVTLNFRQTDLRTALEFLAKSFNVNLMFDEAFKSTPVTLYARDVTFEQGLNLLLSTSRTFYKRIGVNTIVIAPDTKEKRGQYEEHLVRSFPLNAMSAKEMADLVKGVLSVRKIIVNEELNTLTVRDTAEVLALVERLIAANDRKPAEILLEVEILEVNRNKAERLGLDLGSYAIGATVPSYRLSGSFRDAIDAGMLTVPSATLRFFKQDVDAKTLANPRIRVLNGKEAKIHIGDRVPLRSATIQDATGQVRTTFDYREIGIRFVVQPSIHFDNSASVKLSLEVSSLGENVGTANEPAFRIGTRNADTYMLLRDGETAILGGLIRDEERRTRLKIPGLGDIPALGMLFTATDDAVGRTDVLLTITPRVVRSWDVPPRAAREFYSGTENTYTTEPVFAFLDAVEGQAPPIIDTSGAGPFDPSAESEADRDAAASTQPAPATAGVIGQDPIGAMDDVSALPHPESPAASGEEPHDAEPPPETVPLPEASSVPQPVPVIAFAEPVYEVRSGAEVSVQLDAQHLRPLADGPLEVIYNPQLLGFVSATSSDPALPGVVAEADAERGVVRITLPSATATPLPERAALARIVLRGAKPGVSYLICRAPPLKSEEQEEVHAQVRASRILVR